MFDLSQQFLIIGMGASGQSMVRFLTSKGVKNEQLCVADSRANPPKTDLPDDIAKHTGSLPDQLLQDIDCVLVSPGVDLRQPLFTSAKQAGVPVIGDIQLFSEFADAPVIALTGSNGKSTTVTLLHEMALACGLDARLGGNIGTPALELLDDSYDRNAGQNQKPEVYILELSSFQLESTHHLPLQAAAVLNISVDHMDRYDDLADYIDAKAQILMHAEQCVLNADDSAVMGMLEAYTAKDSTAIKPIITVTTSEPKIGQYGLKTNGSDLALIDSQGEVITLASGMKVAGVQNYSNGLVAVAIADACGWSRGPVQAALQSFSGLAHRMQWVSSHNDIDYFNDSKGTNVGATLAAINGLSQPLVLILGGQGKGGDFSPLLNAFKNKARAVVLIGEDAQLIGDALTDLLTFEVSIQHAADMQDAVNRAGQLAQPGDAVVLSPACASFDMFDGFEHRGESFIAAVDALTEAPGEHGGGQV